MASERFDQSKIDYLRRISRVRSVVSVNVICAQTYAAPKTASKMGGGHRGHNPTPLVAIAPAVGCDGTAWPSTASSSMLLLPSVGSDSDLNNMAFRCGRPESAANWREDETEEDGTCCCWASLHQFTPFSRFTTLRIRSAHFCATKLRAIAFARVP